MYIPYQILRQGEYSLPPPPPNEKKDLPLVLSGSSSLFSFSSGIGGVIDLDRETKTGALERNFKLCLTMYLCEKSG